LAKMLQGIANNIGSVINSGANIIVQLVSGISNAIGKVISAGANAISSFVNAIGSGASKVIGAGVDMIVHVVTGIANNFGKMVSAGVDAIGKFISAIASGSNQMIQKGADAVINFVNGVANTIRSREPQLIAAGANLGSAICEGMINGMGSLAGKVISKAESIVSGIPGAVKKLLGIGSPSKVFHEIGVDTIQGLVNGLEANADEPVKSIENIAQSMVDTLSNATDTLGGMAEFNPTITPVVDLTQVQEGANQMSDMLNASATVTPTVSYGQASAISSSTLSADGGATDTTAQGGTSITYQQNNYSPEALSEIEIYRQTKNQLSQLRSALAT
jgi:phage-related protein